MSTPTSATGEVIPEPDCPDDSSLVRLVYHRDLTFPAEQVWAALTEPAELGSWYGEYVGDPASGRVQLTMTDELDTATTEVRILRCTPPSGYTVDQDGWLLDIALHPREGVTVLDFTHHHVPRSAVGEIGPGWQYYLDRLTAALSGIPFPHWDDYLSLVDEYR
ncbi:SRPBCC domain-containing protein [Rhodococcus sp. CH91]|uniref:SRPBCC domain-containing protein n=1 Tax=Rhodococcus sp. CH91 TaxID=2910256 RepID=UPI001F4AE8B5|nr:SRPBCC domain-containing protein [Rhodococcus sp. CH91]